MQILNSLFTQQLRQLNCHADYARCHPTHFFLNSKIISFFFNNEVYFCLKKEIMFQWMAIGPVVLSQLHFIYSK